VLPPQRNTSGTRIRVIAITRFLQPPKFKSTKFTQLQMGPLTSQAEHKILETSGFSSDIRNSSKLDLGRKVPVLGCLFFGDAVAVAATDR